MCFSLLYLTLLLELLMILYVLFDFWFDAPCVLMPLSEGMLSPLHLSLMVLDLPTGWRGISACPQCSKQHSIILHVAEVNSLNILNCGVHTFSVLRTHTAHTQAHTHSEHWNRNWKDFLLLLPLEEIIFIQK